MIHTENKSNVAVISKNGKYTYQQFIQKVNKFSEVFKGKRFEKIAIISENRAEWLFAFYAGWKNNCTVVPIDFLSSVDDISYILMDCKPELIFMSNETTEKVQKVKPYLNYYPELVDFDNIHFSDESDDFELKLNYNGDDTAVIIYTSGTTGSPKGVMLSFRNLLANVTAVSRDVEIYTKKRQVLMLLPLHHIFPLAGSMLAPLSVGGTVVMSPSMQSSDIIETLKNNKVSIIIGVPRFYDLLYKGLNAKIEARIIGKLFYAFAYRIKTKMLAKRIFKKVHVGFGGHVEYLVSGGAALNTEVALFFDTLGFTVLEGYGMTETAPMITFPRPDRVKLGSVGQILPGLTMEIRDREIVVKGANVMKGYYKRPEETSEVLKNGWLYTGDLGIIDKDGYLYITGRKKEIIVLPNGKNINPVELEEKLENSEYVKEAGVFLMDEKLHTVVLPDTESLTMNGIKDYDKFFKEEIMPFFNKDLTSYKRIMKFSLLKEGIPRTRLGKIQRYKLTELFKKPAASKQQETWPESEEYIAIKSFIESQVDISVLQDDHLEYDIALDSLGRISLIDFIERTFGVKIEEENLLEFPSIGKMANYITKHKIFHKLEKYDWSKILSEKIDLKLSKPWGTLPFIIKSSRNLLKVYFRFKSTGHKQLPEGAAIIAPNHQSFFDALFVTAHLKKKVIKETFFYAKKKHVKSRFFSFLAGKNNVIIMDLNNDLKKSIQKMAAVLNSGKKIMIFPEGTRTKNGALGEFKKTFAILSKELNVPVIPVAISGAFNALPVGARFPRMFAKINVSYLETIYPQSYSLDTLAQKVEDSIRKML